MSNDYNGNGHANGNGKIFDLAPKQDPMLAQIVPAARKRVAVMHRLSFGARNFFAWLTDQSLTPGSNIMKGVLKISDHDAGVRFKVHSKTIRNWKRELESTGEVWLTEKWMKNSFPQTVYNITAIVGQATLPMNAHSADGSLADDEVFSSNRRRQQSARRDPDTGSFACRIHGKSGCELCRRQTPRGVFMPEVSPQITRNQAETDTEEKILPSATAMDCRPPRQNGAAHSGKLVPSPTAIDCRPARQNGAVDDGTALPPTTAPICRSTGKLVAGNGKALGLDSGSQRVKRGEPTPPNEAVEAAIKDGDTAFGDWCASWEGAFRSKWEKELGRIKVKLQASPSAFWQRRAEFLRFKLDGGKPPTATKPATVKPVRTSTATNEAKPMPLEQRQKLWNAAKKSISPEPVAAGA